MGTEDHGVAVSEETLLYTNIDQAIGNCKVRYAPLA